MVTLLALLALVLNFAVLGVLVTPAADPVRAAQYARLNAVVLLVLTVWLAVSR